MDINQLGTLDAIEDYRNINRRMTKALDTLASGVKATSSKDDPVLWGDVQGLKTTVGRLQAYSENLYRGASSVRLALSSMESSKQHLEAMTGVLNNALSSPEGSGARTAALRQYNELHVLVNDFSAPKDLGARKLLDGPNRFSGAGSLAIATGENGYQIVLRNQQIHSGAAGIDLPKVGEALPSDPTAPPAIAQLEKATDEEIGRMLEQVGRSRERLLDKMEGLSRDASTLERATDFTTALVHRNEASVAALNVPDLKAEAILAQALSVRGSVALFGLTGLNESKRIALSLLQ